MAFGFDDRNLRQSVGDPDDELQAALTSAQGRGRRRMAEILTEDDMLSAEAFADLVDVSSVRKTMLLRHHRRLKVSLFSCQFQLSIS